MSNSNMLEIIQGLAQAAACAYDGAHDERFSTKDKALKTGLKREEGDLMLDQRVNDGFKVRFHGDQICIHYQSDVLLKDIYKGNFENEMSQMINEVKKYLQKEYKSITGNSVTLTKAGDINIIAQSVSRVRSFVQASQYFNVSGLKMDPISGGSEGRTVDSAIRSFLDLKSNKKPKNVTRKKD